MSANAGLPIPHAHVDEPAPTREPDRQPPAIRTRRSLLAGALGGLATAVATSLGRPNPASAAAGSTLIIGSEANNAGTANTQLLTYSNVVAFKLLQTGPGTALMGYATPAFGSTRGVYGRTDSPNGFGVQARNAGAAGAGAAVQAIGVNNLGVDASTEDGNGYAVRATNTGLDGDGAAIEANGGVQRGVYATSGSTIGVYGITVNGVAGVVGTASTGIGVYGTSGPGDGVRGQSSGVRGVYGNSSHQFGEGVVGLGAVHGISGSISNDVGTSAGVYGESAGNNSYAGYFVGHVGVTGVIENAGGLFKIDHPLDPANRILQHSSVVSPDMKNVYDGVVTADIKGEGTVELPSYVEALNRDVRYQLTPIGAFAPLYVKSKVAGGRFTIAGANPGQEVSWQLTGVRKDAWADAHGVVVERDKTGDQRGRYFHPLEHGQPASKGVDYPMQQRLAAAREQAEEAPAAH